MPFTEIKSGRDKGKFVSENGRVFTKKQVDLYHATNGFDKRKLAERELGKVMKNLNNNGKQNNS